MFTWHRTEFISHTHTREHAHIRECTHKHTDCTLLYLPFIHTTDLNLLLNTYCSTIISLCESWVEFTDRRQVLRYPIRPQLASGILHKFHPIDQQGQWLVLPGLTQGFKFGVKFSQKVSVWRRILATFISALDAERLDWFCRCSLCCFPYRSPWWSGAVHCACVSDETLNQGPDS